jgi:hypothetical protein
VRYDVDNERIGPGGGPLGAHLNVLKPAPLHDRIHFPALSGSAHVWNVREVIDLFLAVEFVAELHERVDN